MKTFLVILAIAFVSVNADSSSEELDLNNLKELNELLLAKFNISFRGSVINLVDKVIKEKYPYLESKIKAAEIDSCLEGIEWGSDTFCTIIKKKIAKCTAPAREFFVGSLPEKFKDFPMLREKIESALIDQQCTSTVEESIELINPCTREKDFDEIPACEEIVNAYRKQKNELPSMDMICDMIPKLKPCVKDHLKATCKNPVTRRAHMNFYKAIEDAFKAQCEELNKA